MDRVDNVVIQRSAGSWKKESKRRKENKLKLSHLEMER